MYVRLILIELFIFFNYVITLCDIAVPFYSVIVKILQILCFSAATKTSTGRKRNRTKKQTLFTILKCEHTLAVKNIRPEGAKLVKKCIR